MGLHYLKKTRFSVQSTRDRQRLVFIAITHTSYIIVLSSISQLSFLYIFSEMVLAIFPNITVLPQTQLHHFVYKFLLIRFLAFHEVREEKKIILFTNRCSSSEVTDNLALS